MVVVICENDPMVPMHQSIGVLHPVQVVHEVPQVLQDVLQVAQLLVSAVEVLKLVVVEEEVVLCCQLGHCQVDLLVGLHGPPPDPGLPPRAGSSPGAPLLGLGAPSPPDYVPPPGYPKVSLKVGTWAVSLRVGAYWIEPMGLLMT